MRLFVSLYITSTCYSLLCNALTNSQIQSKREKLWPGHRLATKAFFEEGSSASTSDVSSITLTYLEINGWLLTAGGITILIDPILEGNLDFGFPSLYKAKKRVLPSRSLTKTLPPIDALLITQGLDDHAHEKTLRELYAIDPTLPVYAPPSARSVLERCGFLSKTTTYLASKVRKLEMPYFGLDLIPTIRLPDSSNNIDKAMIRSRRNNINSSEGVSVTATSGALVGPPWQQRENGYIIKHSTGPSLYIEPHVEFDKSELGRLGPVDAVITPCSGMGLPGFELVHGPRATAELVEILQPRWVVPMANGGIDSTGIISPYVKEIGLPIDFESYLKRKPKKMEVLRVKPGVATHIGSK